MSDDDQGQPRTEPATAPDPASRLRSMPSAPGEASLATLTRAIAAIYKDQFGRGPTSAYSYLVGPNGIVVALEGTLTPVESHMVEMGAHDRLRELRLLFQHATEPRFREAVERITSRKVVAFTSGLDVEADIATEYFLLDRPLPKRVR